MGLRYMTRIKVVVVVASATLVGASGLAFAQQPKRQKALPTESKADSSPAERVAGVVVKVEKIAKDGTSLKAGKAKAEDKRAPALLRVSVNTNAVWRDWARDQAQVRDDQSPKKDAAKGANSIATKGQPADENSLVVIEVAPGTRVETRFRSPTDETSKGVKAPSQVKSDEGTASKVPAKGKPVQFSADDLAPGLFVEVEFEKSQPQDKNAAAIVTVIRPIEVLNSSPAAQASPK